MKSKRYTLTEGEQRKLRTNPHVVSCSARMIQYTPDFKRHVLSEHAKGKRPKDIFAEAGIPLECLGGDYARRIREWRSLVNKHGIQYFDVEHRGSHGAALAARRQKIKTYDAMTKEQKIAYLEAENEALEYVRRHFGLPPSLRKQSHSSRRRRNIKS
jgi:transposase